MTSKLGFFGAIVVTLGAVASVGAFPSPSKMPAAPPTDACALLTQAQVSTVLGESVGTGHRITTNSSMCGWEAPGQKATERKRVIVSIYTPTGGFTSVDRFNNAKKPVQGIKKEPVSGVGDDAVYVTTQGFGTGLIFRKGSAAFDVEVHGLPLDQIKAKEKKLALDLIGRL